MKIILRRARPNDWLQLKELFKNIWVEHRPLFLKIDPSFREFANKKPSKKRFLEKLQSQEMRLAVALDGPRLIGYSFVHIQKEKNPLIVIGCLTQIYLLPEYRGKGIADMLWNDALVWFKKKKVDYLQLSVAINNKRAIEVYKKWGFKPFLSLMRKKF